MKLFIDDTRPIPFGFVLARSVKEAIKKCRHQQFEQISIDYNLVFRKENGLDIIKRFKEEDYYVLHVNLHSDDLIGIFKIENELKSLLIEGKEHVIKITKMSY